MTITEKKAGATLNKEFIFPEGKMTRLAWLKQRKFEGCTIESRQVRQWKREEKEKESLDFLFRTMPFGNPNHPDCKEYNERKEILKKGFFTTEYSVVYPDRCSVVITKTEFDLFPTL